MHAIDIGRICVKISGREAGKKCVVLEIIDKNFALITGPLKVNGVKRRRVNIGHIFPTEEKIKIDRGATDEEVEEVLTERTPKYRAASDVEIDTSALTVDQAVQRIADVFNGCPTHRNATGRHSSR